jgi:hypothetical protein
MDSNPKVKESSIIMQKYYSKQTIGFRVAYARLILQVSSNFQNFRHFPKHLSDFSVLQHLNF